MKDEVSTPEGSEALSPTFRTRIRARSYELDGFGHVNHAVFLNYFEQARFEALEAGGLPLDELVRSGLAVVVVRVEVDYRDEVRLGDELEIRTVVEGVRNTSMTLRQQAVALADPEEPAGRGESVAAEARVVAVWLEGGRPVRIPDRVRAALGLLDTG